MGATRAGPGRSALSPLDGPVFDRTFPIAANGFEGEARIYRSVQPGTCQQAQRPPVAGIPRFRGVSHQFASRSRSSRAALWRSTRATPTARASAIVFAASVAAMFGASALPPVSVLPGAATTVTPARPRDDLHADCRHVHAVRLSRSPPWVAGSDPLDRVGGALLAIAVQWCWPARPPWLAAALGIVLGWIAVIAFPQIVGGIGVPGSVLLVAGGSAYTLGAIVYARERPDPSHTSSVITRSFTDSSWSRSPASIRRSRSSSCREHEAGDRRAAASPCTRCRHLGHDASRSRDPGGRAAREGTVDRGDDSRRSPHHRPEAGDRPPWPALVFVNGATPDGRNHPIVRRLGLGLAQAGFLVFVPNCRASREVSSHPRRCGRRSSW